MLSVDIENELHCYLELPLTERAEHADEFLDKASRRMMELNPVLVARAERMFPGGGEDVASGVILKGFEWLKAQIMGKPTPLPWNRPTPMIAWLFRIQGIPFQGRNSGLITNDIRRERKHSSSSRVDAEDFDVEDELAVDAEQTLLIKERSLQIEAKLGEIGAEGAKMARDVFVFRARTGLHRFRELNPDTLSALAKELKLDQATCNTVRSIARLKKLNGNATLDPETVGELVGLKERQVRNIVEKVISLMRPPGE